MRVGDIVEASHDEAPAWAIVLSTSRSKRRLHFAVAHGLLVAHAIDNWGYDSDEDRRMLASVLLPTVQTESVVDHWRRVTKAEIVNGTHDFCDLGCDPGAWCTAGQGKGRVTVCSLPQSPVHDVLDNLPRGQA